MPWQITRDDLSTRIAMYGCFLYPKFFARDRLLPDTRRPTQELTRGGSRQPRRHRRRFAHSAGFMSSILMSSTLGKSSGGESMKPGGVSILKIELATPASRSTSLNVTK